MFGEIKFTDRDVVNPDDFIPAGESNPHHVRPWLLHDHGCVLAVVLADCLQDAIDEACDANRLERYAIYGADRDSYNWETEEGISRLGNAGGAFDIESLGALEMPIPPFSFAAMFAASR